MKLRDKESWITTAKKELECSELIAEARLEAVKEIRVLKDKMKEICNSSSELIEAVEKYIQPKKGEFLSRIELLVVLRKVKKIICDN